jgi:phenylalanyl-tRNA synthetase beta chain
MKISYNWLKEYINIDLDPDKAAEILTDIGLEIEGIEEYESIKGGFEGLVVGQVQTCEKHPNADKLSVCLVNVGETEPLHIVCGAPNVAAGQKVVVAPVGTTLYSGEESFKIKKTKLRGELSEGMICAEDEIGLGDSHEGIMVLNNDAPIGTQIKDYVDVKNEKDIVFEIGLTPNRVDGASHYGVARDLAAYFSIHEPKVLTKPSVENFKTDNNNLHIPVKIENTDACKRYSGLTISNIEIKESTAWLKNRLNAIGLRPINNVVDVTNYVLHETGQPLHAFDAEKITGNEVIVKTLDAGTKFKTLDEADRVLHKDDLMICNSTEGMCLAGVFGGHNSGVTENTKNIFLECANFDPVYVRKTAKRFGLSTDSSFRFERGADPNNTVYTLKRCAMLIKELAGGEISSDVIDVYPEPIEDFEVKVSFKNIDRLIGQKIKKETIKTLLEALEMNIKSETEEEMTLLVPPYRVDVQREADIIEDILRLYGYNNIAIGSQVNSTLSYSQKPDKDQMKNLIADLLTGKGYYEMWNNSLSKHDYYEKLESYKGKKSVLIMNALSNDLNAMRQTLLFGGLEAIIHNINRKNSDLKLFEFGFTYSMDPDSKSENWEDRYHEEEHLGIFLSGNYYNKDWKVDEKKSDFYDLKAQTEHILAKLGIKSVQIENCESDIYSQGLNYIVNDKVVATAGVVNTKILKTFDIEQDVFFGDINWHLILELLKEVETTFEELPKSHPVKRDLALLVDKEVTFEQIKEVAEKAEKHLLQSISLFDIYEGKNLPTGKKSYAITLILQDKSKTMNDKQIDRAMSNFVKRFKFELNAELR